MSSQIVRFGGRSVDGVGWVKCYLTPSSMQEMWKQLEAKAAGGGSDIFNTDKNSSCFCPSLPPLLPPALPVCLC